MPELASFSFSLRVAAKSGHSYNGVDDRVDLFLKEGEEIRFKEYRNLYSCEAHRLPCESANAVIALVVRNFSSDRSVDINVIHASYNVHSNGVLLRETAKKLNITMTEERKAFYGCSLSKGPRKPISSSIHFRAAVQLE